MHVAIKWFQISNVTPLDCCKTQSVRMKCIHVMYDVDEQTFTETNILWTYLGRWISPRQYKFLISHHKICWSDMEYRSEQINARKVKFINRASKFHCFFGLNLGNAVACMLIHSLASLSIRYTIYELRACLDFPHVLFYHRTTNAIQILYTFCIEASSGSVLPYRMNELKRTNAEVHTNGTLTNCETEQKMRGNHTLCTNE